MTDAGTPQDPPLQYVREGWTVLPGLLKAEETRDLVLACERLAASGREGPGLRFMDVFADGRERLARVERLADALPGFAGGPLARRLEALAGRCLGGPAVLFKDKLNIRPAGGPGYAPHQDAARWDHIADRFVSIGLFLDRSDPVHGGFEFAEAPRDAGRMRNRGGDLDPEGFARLPRRTVAAEPGDAILIDGDAPHRTLDNRSERTIHHILFTYASSADPALRARFYRDLAARFAEIREGNAFLFPAR